MTDQPKIPDCEPQPWDLEPDKWVTDPFPVREPWQDDPGRVCSLEGCDDRRYEIEPHPTGEVVFDDATGVHESVMSGRHWRSSFCERHYDSLLAKRDPRIYADGFPFE